MMDRILDRIEEENRVRILYACESGSRCWGFSSADSDYDLRYVYVHPAEWYTSIKTCGKRDTIEGVDIDTDIKLDASGWELRKTLNLFDKGNPPLIEWLTSPVVYADRYRFRERLAGLLGDPARSIPHYYHMANSNYNRYLLGKTMKWKKYLYVIRPLLCIMYIEEKGEFPPMDMEELLFSLPIHDKTRMTIFGLITAKRDGLELGECEKNDRLSGFCRGALMTISPTTEYMKSDMVEDLDKLFREMVYGIACKGR